MFQYLYLNMNVNMEINFEVNRDRRPHPFFCKRHFQSLLRHCLLGYVFHIKLYLFQGRSLTMFEQITQPHVPILNLTLLLK